MDAPPRDADRSGPGPVSGPENGLERMAREALVWLQSATGLESVYLTRVDAARQTMDVLYAANAEPAAIEIPEGASAPWAMTVCRRALAEDTPYTAHADTDWADLPAVRALGLRTYLSAPVRAAGGELLGTLCAVSDRRVEVDAGGRRLVRLFAGLLGNALERERLLAERDRHDAEAQVDARTDALTGVANRRALDEEIGRALAHAAREGGRVVAAFVDLDRFKLVNDLHGHAAGDRLLAAVARRLAAATRAGELLGRYGGDEFVVVGRSASGQVNELLMSERLAVATRGRFELGEAASLDYGGASVGAALSEPGDDTNALLRRADAAMYAIKKTRAGDGGSGGAG